MHKTKSGFTIVELLIVIVVIGILAAITIVAYNGIQQRARNNQTTQALVSWTKAINLYKADKGVWPPYYTCLGVGYKYGSAGTATSGTAQCRQTSVSDVAVEDAGFKTAMQEYVSGNPTPAFVTAAATTTNWYRGITYYYGGGAPGSAAYYQAVYEGLVTCPTIGGLTMGNEQQNFGGSGNTYCNYIVGYS